MRYANKSIPDPDDTDTTQMLDFDKAFNKKSTTRLDEMWSILSAIGLWANVEDVSELISMCMWLCYTIAFPNIYQIATMVTRHAS
jgi:hypothetical protein